MHLPFWLLPFTLALLAHCTVISETSSTHTLYCSSSFYSTSIPILNSSTWYILKLELATENSLPIVLLLGNSLTAFDDSNLAGYQTKDDDALHAHSKIQILSYAPSSEQLSFVVVVHRVNLRSLLYSNNLDQQIQNYKGNNPSELQCNKPISFKLTVTNLDSSPPILPISTRPFSQLDCNQGLFVPETSSCDCPFSLSTSLCYGPFWWLSEGVLTRNSIQRDQRHFYVYEPKLQNQYMSVTVKIQLQGDSSSDYRFTPEALSPAFTILWYIQPTDIPLQPPSVFNQMNPSSIDGLVVAAGRRLVLTVYKPSWSTNQYYSITIAGKQNSFQQFIIILIAVCSTVSVLFIVAFVVYLAIGKKLRGDMELMARLGLAASPQNSNTNKIYNEFFDLEAFFPSLPFEQISKQSKLDSCCSICLEPLMPVSDIKLTICVHVFHSKCIRQWMTRQQSCPLCRRQFDNRVVELELLRININSDTPPTERCAKIIADSKKYHENVEVKQLAEESTPHYDSIDNHLVIDFE